MKFATLLFGLFSLGHILSAGPFPCVPGTLASYIALGVSGCAVGDIEFVNFAYASKGAGGAPEISPDLIQVAPVFVAPDAASLNFSANWLASGGQSQESAIVYTVVVTSRHSSASLTLQMGTAQPGQAGVVAIDERTSVGDVQIFTQCAQTCHSKTDDTLNFAPVPGEIRVLTQVKLNSIRGNSALEGFTALVNLCPPCV